MALTGWEGLKVAGTVLKDLGEEGEKFEDENPGEKFKLSKGKVVDIVVNTLTDLGKEVMD